MTAWTPGNDVLVLREGGAAEPMPSVDFQDLSLRQAKSALVFVKEFDQGVHIYAMVEVHILLGWIINLGDGDGLSN